MAISAEQAKIALIAMQRFGLGPKVGSLERIGSNPIDAVKSELNYPEKALITVSGLPSYIKAAQGSQQGFGVSHDLYRRELRVRLYKHLQPYVGLLERLVLFWSNHFSMSINKSETVRGTIGQLERDVIRKNVLGSFTNMLRGVIRHPAMVHYLDNQDSIGPLSTIGKSWGAGYNENLAREILELHTVGSGGGYTETDVTNLALILTGWSYVRGWESDYGYNGGTAANRGQFIFRKSWHQPGTIRLMGKSYANTGIDQGRAVLADLVKKRQTAEHLAFKLVHHFITDTPTAAMVKPVADAFFRTGGNLKATTLALLNLPEAFTAPLTKIRTPYELAVAQYRAVGAIPEPDDEWAFTEPLRAMKNLPWERSTPDGYPDESLHWLSPDAMTIRLDTAQLATWMFTDTVRDRPGQLAMKLYGPALSKTTLDRMVMAGDRNGAFTVFFMSPEFQRR